MMLLAQVQNSKLARTPFTDRVTVAGLTAALGMAVLLAASGMACAASVPGTDVLYTLDANFDQGTLLNVNHTAPNNDQLQLNKTTTPFPFVNVAASNRGTIQRIDANTGKILGEFLTAPDGMGRNPSRTTVDQLGNVWVANRDESGESPSGSGVGKGSVARIGLIIGGTRIDAGGTPNPAGHYLKPPFQYNTCVDRNGDGLITTSFGQGDILPWTNTGGADTHGGVSTAEDECIINYTRVSGTGTRTIAVDPNNDVWVGGTGNYEHEKLSGVTGQPIPGTQFNLGWGCGGYGGLVDKNNVLWSSGNATGYLARFDANTMTGSCLYTSISSYGLGIDPKTGEIWSSSLYGDVVAKIAPAGSILNYFNHGHYYAQGVAVDGNDTMWVASSLYDQWVDRLKTDGTYVGSVYVGGGPTGVSVDSNGKIWTTNYYGWEAVRIDPTLGTAGEVDLRVYLGDYSYPYSYSDMTGFVSIGATSPQGSWTATQDSGVAGTKWGKITWNSEPQGSVPAGTSITVQARAADTEAGLTSQPFVAVSNGASFELTGRYIEVQATLKAGSDGTSPVLSDIRIAVANKPPVCTSATASPSPIWAPNGKLVPVSIAGVTDPDGDPVTISATAIFQDEAVKAQGVGAGNTSPDATLSPLAVRAERNGNPKSPGNGRVYHITFTAEDGKGGTCTGTVQVCVPHDQRPGSTCVDDGSLYNSLIP